MGTAVSPNLLHFVPESFYPYTYQYDFVPWWPQRYKKNPMMMAKQHIFKENYHWKFISYNLYLISKKVTVRAPWKTTFKLNLTGKRIIIFARNEKFDTMWLMMAKCFIRSILFHEHFPHLLMMLSYDYGKNTNMWPTITGFFRRIHQALDNYKKGVRVHFPFPF